MIKNKDPVKTLDFKVTPLNVGDYYGIMVNGDHKYMTSDGIIHNNSGKSVCEQAID